MTLYASIEWILSIKFNAHLQLFFPWALEVGQRQGFYGNIGRLQRVVVILLKVLGGVLLLEMTLYTSIE